MSVRFSFPESWASTSLAKKRCPALLRISLPLTPPSFLSKGTHNVSDVCAIKSPRHPALRLKTEPLSRNGRGPTMHRRERERRGWESAAKVGDPQVD